MYVNLKNYLSWKINIEAISSCEYFDFNMNQRYTYMYGLVLVILSLLYM